MLTQVVRSIWADPSNAGFEKFYRLGAGVLYQIYKRAVGTPFVLNYRTGMKITMFNDNPQYSSLIYFRHPDLHEISHMKTLIRYGAVVYDIGANVGIYPVLLGERIREIRLYAFEASEACFRRLLDLKHLNALGDRNFVPVHAAISDADGFVTFGSADPLYPGNAIVPDGTGKWKVPCRSIDAMVFGGEIEPPSLMKVDVEGFETAVFRGAVRTLSEHHPVLMFECLAKSGNFAEIRALLGDLGYRIYFLEADGTSSCDERRMEELVASSRLKNLFATWWEDRSG